MPEPCQNWSRGWHRDLTSSQSLNNNLNLSLRCNRGLHRDPNLSLSLGLRLSSRAHDLVSVLQQPSAPSRLDFTYRLQRILKTLFEKLAPSSS
jgi:hypothetical protein